MKYFTLITALFICRMASAQSLPFTFESDITTEDFIDFDGGTATVLPNPDMSAGNPSPIVAQIIRDGGEIWSGSKVALDANLDFSSEATLSMKVWTTAPAGTTVKFKLEGDGATERDTQTTVSGAWETLTWDFTGEPTNFNEVVFMFDFGNQGDGSETSTFYFDDVEQVFGGAQIDHPCNFDEEGINYTTTPFEGNSSALVTDPTDASNNVIASQKTENASPSAGTTIGTNAGFATDLPLTLDDSFMSVRVWSPEAGVPVRLKVEDSNDPTHTCETQVNTTVGGAWEILIFDFTDQAEGTELLSVGLDMGWTYNMASIFFNFGSGAAAEEPTYYFDDVTFGILIDNIEETEAKIKVSAYPNPSSSEWNITSDNGNISSIELYTLIGELVSVIPASDSSVQISASHLGTGIYYAKVFSGNKSKTIKLIKE